jgi:prepilin-type N-terminal cleavage/methylation domain-containing protein
VRWFVLEQRGMTVVELLVAVAIIGVGLVALLSAIPLAAYGIQEGNQLSTATFLANQRLEQIRNATWQAGQPAPAVPVVLAVDKLGASASDTAPVGDGGVTTFPDETPMAAPNAGYRRTVRITDCGVGAGCSSVVSADLRRATVTVSYRPMTGIGVAPATTAKSAVVTIYIAKR